LSFPEENALVEATPADGAWVPAGTDYASDRRFDELPLQDALIQGITEHVYTLATPVQAATVLPALAGRDLLVRAKTGTGKTAAFVVPTLDRLVGSQARPGALVLAPTRELAQQIAEEFVALGKYLGLTVATLVGGLPMGPQEKDLAAGAAVVVGTPGRVLDHLRRGNLHLGDLVTAILDEADEMVSMGFLEDVTSILDRCGETRQVLLFSATITGETERLVARYLKDPERITLSTDADNVHNIEHRIYETQPTAHKVRALLSLLDIEDPTSAIIFCNTREDCATVASYLDRQGLDVHLLSGELSQTRRSQVMAQVKRGAVRFLVSTDVAARGIDISDLSHVINYALPPEAAVYLHRTGRTGRIGKKGVAISLVGGGDLATRKTLESRHGLRFDARQLPDEAVVVAARVERQARQIKEAMGALAFESYLPTVRALRDRPDGDLLLAAALRAFFQWDRQRRIDAGEEQSSVRELLDARSAKITRDDRRGDRRRDERSERPERRERREKPAPSRQDEADLDALLVSDDPPSAPEAPDEAKKKKRRRRKGKGAGAQEAGRVAPTEADELEGLLSEETELSLLEEGPAAAAEERPAAGASDPVEWDTLLESSDLSDSDTLPALDDLLLEEEPSAAPWPTQETAPVSTIDLDDLDSLLSAD
jgi:ATP-dependent RNA helicase DeaD